MKAIILAAGKGIRMRPLTVHRPKPMLPIANIPILERIIDNLKAAGVSESLIVTGHQAEVIEEYFGDGERFGIRIDYRRQEILEGTAKAALLAEEFTKDEAFLLVFGDIMTPKENYVGLLQAYKREPADIYLCTAKVAEPWKGGVVYVEDGTVVNIVEKPEPSACTSDLQNAGIFIFSPEIFELLHRTPKSPRGEYELTWAIEMMIDTGRPTRAYLLEGYWSNIGIPSEIIGLNRFILDGVVAQLSASGSSAEEAIFVGPGTEISSKAELRGPLIIGANCRIGSSNIEEYSCISDKVRVGDAVSIKSTAILPSSFVRDGCELSLALLGSNVIIGESIAIRGQEDEVAVVADDSVVTRSFRVH